MFLTHLRSERAILLTHKALYHLPHLFPISPVSPVSFSSTNSHSGIWLLPPTLKLSISGPLRWRFPLPSLGSLNGRCLLSLNLTSSDYTFGNKTYFLSMCPVYFLPVCLLPSCLFSSFLSIFLCSSPPPERQLLESRTPVSLVVPSVAGTVTHITCGMNDPWLAIAWWH